MTGETGVPTPKPTPVHATESTTEIAPAPAPAPATAPATATATTTTWYTRPGLVLTLLAAIVVTTALLVRTPVSGRQGDPRLSAFSSDPLGAKLLYELASRLGVAVERRRTADLPDAPDAIIAVLDPTIAMTASETHQILQHVRGGAGLLLVLGNGTAEFSDSLRLSVAPLAGLLYADSAAARRCDQSAVQRFTRQSLWIGRPTLLALQGLALRAPGVRPLLQVTGKPPGVGYPAMVTMPYGRGRMVVAADPDVFRNDALRDCSYGLDVAAVTALSWLSGGDFAAHTLVFDEQHQGRGARVGIPGAVQAYLTGTGSGRMLLQVALGGVVLLIALAVRVLPPREDRRIERRSPLEHVDALARAYLQVGATRTGAHRLVRGLRRRVDRTVARATTTATDQDDAFLRRVAERQPALDSDVALLRRALDHSISVAEFRELAPALCRIETALTRT